MAEEKQPYWVELESQECSHCGAGSFWIVVHIENGEEVAGSTSYGDKETAEDIADLQNAAYACGKAALEAELAEAKRDSERLDWIEASSGETSQEQIEDDPSDEETEMHEGWAVYAMPEVNGRRKIVSATADTLRDAIDAAMSQEGGNG